MTEPSEYCLLWIQWWPVCMTKYEWASWVQAVGSVVAIGGAFWLGGRHEAAARKLEEDKRALDNFFRIELLHQLFFEGRRLCDDILSTTVAPLSNRILDDLLTLAKRADDLREEFRDAPIFLIDDTGIARSALHARSELNKLTAGLAASNPASFPGNLEASKERLNDLRQIAVHAKASTFVMGETICRSHTENFRRSRARPVWRLVRNSREGR